MDPVSYARALGLEPIVAGQDQLIRRDQALAGGMTRTVGGSEDVTVPAGTYRAVRVVASRADGGREAVVHWYAAGVGEVKRVVRAADGTETVRRALAAFAPGKE